MTPVQAPLPDPTRDGGAVFLEELVQVTLRDVYCGRDVARCERRVGKVGLRMRTRA